MMTEEKHFLASHLGYNIAADKTAYKIYYPNYSYTQAYYMIQFMLNWLTN